ncbi:MAG: recombinase family protein [Planctomycetes bacterium]|nr:recombinase family protein [Planctomycetota bacterium]
MTEEGTQPRVVGYIRVSQERNATNGYGLGAQETDIRRYAEYKRWALARIYREEGVSGYLKDRPALEKLLADAKAGAFDIVIFPSIDRAGRSVRDVIEIDGALQAASVVTIFLREGIDTSTATGEFFRNIMASLAEFEGQLIYERLSKGKLRKRSEGRYVGGWIPYGYRRDEEGNIAIVPEEAAVVERIFRWCAEERSLRWIGKQLDELKAPTRKGGHWMNSTINSTRRNRFYAGMVSCEGRWIRGEHKPIVTDELYQAANRPRTPAVKRPGATGK